MLSEEYNRLSMFLASKEISGNGTYPLEWSKKTHEKERRSLRRYANSFVLRSEDKILCKISTNSVCIYTFTIPQ
jgi:hypothetical protein